MVGDIKLSEKRIQADVYGTQDYRVIIEFGNNIITHMFCSCPYAAEGEKCKHMAAVLYEWDNGKPKKESYDEDDIVFMSAETKDDYSRKFAVVEKLISSTEEKTVKSFLISVLTEDDKLLLRFKSATKKPTDDIDVLLLVAMCVVTVFLTLLSLRKLNANIADLLNRGRERK